MFIDLKNFIRKNETVAVALSGGGDSMALLHYLINNAKPLNAKIVVLNIEHGIRGKSSVADSSFVKNFCDKNNIPLLSFSVDCKKKAKEEKIPVEAAARLLRYECFYKAITSGACDKVATAHHERDNVESVLFNLFRGTGIKGVSGITSDFDGKIIRPFLSVKKQEIDDYLLKNKIPFVTDETNFDDNYSRNFIRLNLIPLIKEKFPDFENAISRFALSAKLDEDYIFSVAQNSVTLSPDKAEINIPLHYAVFARAVIIALKHLGVKKDWEKSHIDSAYSLMEKPTSAEFTLINGVKIIREYSKLVLLPPKTKTAETKELSLPFNVTDFEYCGKKYSIEKLPVPPTNLKDGLYLDLDKIPKGAKIRTKKDGDVFTKFGGGTKKLNDYFTDVKIPLRLRKNIPIIASDNDILAIFGVAVSNKVKVDKSTINTIKLI